MLVFAQMNHCDTPYMFRIADGTLDQCYEFTSLNKPLVIRPKDDSGDLMSPQDTLGACLGFTLHKTKISGAPETIEIMLTDEEEDLNWPPILFMMQLDGTIRYWQTFYGKWKTTNLLNDPEVVKKSESREPPKHHFGIKAIPNLPEESKKPEPWSPYPDL